MGLCYCLFVYFATLIKLQSNKDKIKGAKKLMRSDKAFN